MTRFRLYKLSDTDTMSTWLLLVSGIVILEIQYWNMYQRKIEIERKGIERVHTFINPTKIHICPSLQIIPKRLTELLIEKMTWNTGGIALRYDSHSLFGFIQCSAYNLRPPLFGTQIEESIENTPRSSAGDQLLRTSRCTWRAITTGPVTIETWPFRRMLDSCSRDSC